MMKVSVLIPYYNDERFLRQAIESVLAQTFADFELVLVNHASTDGSRAIARSFGDPRIVHVDMPVWAQLLLKGCRLGFVESLVASYRVHDGQVSSLGRRLRKRRRGGGDDGQYSL